MSRFTKIVSVLLFLIILASEPEVYSQDPGTMLIENDSAQRILKRLEKDLPLGNININQDPRLDSLLRKHIGYNDSVGIQGWKILIYRGRDLKSAQDISAKFTEVFPDLNMNSMVDYQAPDFKTLVGAFRTREEAYRLHQEIKKEFEYSYLVRATIKARELK